MIMRAPGRVLWLLALTLLLGACRQPVVTHRAEGEANAALEALAGAGIDARKVDAGRDGFDVTVPGSALERSLAILHAAGLPRPKGSGFATLFADPGLVPTGVEERARYQRALAGELAHTLEALDGVREARVHLALPVPVSGPGRDRAPPAPAKASVLLSARPGTGAALRGREPAVRALVAGAVVGLDPAAVTVVVVEAAAPGAPPPRPPHLRAAGLLAGGGTAVALGLCLAGVLVLRRRAPPAEAEG